MNAMSLLCCVPKEGAGDPWPLGRCVCAGILLAAILYFGYYTLFVHDDDIYANDYDSWRDWEDHKG